MRIAIPSPNPIRGRAPSETPPASRTASPSSPARDVDETAEKPSLATLPEELVDLVARDCSAPMLHALGSSSKTLQRITGADALWAPYLEGEQATPPASTQQTVAQHANSAWRAFIEARGNNVTAYKRLPLMLREKPAVALAELPRSSDNMVAIPDSILRDRSLIEKLITVAPSRFSDLPADLRADRDLALIAVRGQGAQVMYVGGALKGDQTIFETALETWSAAYSHVAPELRAKKENAILCLQAGGVFWALEPNWRDDVDVARVSLHKSIYAGGALFKVAGPTVLGDLPFIREIAREAGSMGLQDAPAIAKNDLEYMRLAGNHPRYGNRAAVLKHASVKVKLVLAAEWALGIGR